MPNNWKTYKLSDALEIKYGKDHKKVQDGNIPIYGTGGIMRYGNQALYDKETILIPRKGSLNNIYYLNEPFWSVDTIFWSKINQEVAFPKYLFYNLKVLDFASMDVGSAVPSLTTELLKKLEIKLPSLQEQQSIASILSAIDDKIENNLAINKTQEEMAMALYKHWFVDFGPFQDEEFVESELGMIPKGLEVKKLNKIYSNHNKKRKPISTNERAKIQGIYPYYGATKILDYIDHFNFDGEFILLAEDGTVKTENDTPFLQFISGKFCVSNHAHVLTGNKDYSNEFLFVSLSNKNVIPIITGAVQLKINKENLESLSFITPPTELLKSFEELIIPLYNNIKNLEIENNTLTQLRDTLLPQLISGEVRLKEFQEQLANII
jgi:type I restriction enzyme S subunit